jgi:hypothetical protein
MTRSVPSAETAPEVDGSYEGRLKKRRGFPITHRTGLA